MKFITLEISLDEGHTLVRLLTERLGKDCINRQLPPSEKKQIATMRYNIELQLEGDRT